MTRFPIQIAWWPDRADGTFAPVETGVQVWVAGLYLAPVFVYGGVYPPQIIISLPVQVALCSIRIAGTFAPVDVAIQDSVVALSCPTVSTKADPLHPPHPILSAPVPTAQWQKRAR